MMSRSAPHIVLFFVLLMCLRGPLAWNSGVGKPKIMCKEAERRALLRIKQDLGFVQYGGSGEGDINLDINVLLSSWGEEEERRECCEWIGIRCSNNSGHVIKLDLSPSTFDLDDGHSLHGNISSSLFDLKHLSYLDLSDIYLREFSSIPSSIDSLTKLRYLNLSHTFLGGEAPPQLGNLSSLQFLDLNNNDALKINSLKWVSRLSSLRVLDLSYTNMSLANDWVHVITNPPRFLTKLLLRACHLPNIVTPTSPPLVNSSQVLEVLDLSANLLSHSIFQLLFYYNHSLVHLDLSYCLDLAGPIPNGFSYMATLKYLDLHNNNFEGIIPESFGNMISLRYLHLGDGEEDYCYNQLGAFHPKSFRNMSSLMHLDLSANQLRGSIPESFGNMIALSYLDLGGNQLDSLNPKSFVNMTAIQDLFLESNHLEGSIPENFGNMASLRQLDLSNNMLEGEIPKSIWKICTLRRFSASNNSLSGELHFGQLSSSMSCANFSLEILDLRQNKIKGPLPDFTLYSSLIELLLSSNKFSSIPKSIGQLSNLDSMDLSENSIQGVISEAHFAKLFNLSFLDISANPNLAVNIPSDWIPPFQLDYIRLGSCKLGPHFPNWLQTQKGLTEINISNSGISGSIPDWLWDSYPYLNYLDLSNNELRGNIKERVNVSYESLQSLTAMDLSSNQLQGPIPRHLFQTLSLNLLGNSFSQLNSLCNFTEFIPLAFLDVSYNKLSGELPDCWSLYSLRILILANNNLSGKIPVSIGFLISSSILHLGNNNFTAELPPSLMNCTSLMILDVGENKLSGPLPTWIGTSLTKLIIISLRSNNFSGSMPSQLCHLVDLQLLDLSSNDISGEIQKCLGNMTAMTRIGNGGDLQGPYSGGRGTSYVPQDFIDEKLVLVWKAARSVFRNLGLLKNIDLSSNKLTGEIPRDITKLVGLISLNLSRNNLSGLIPQEIGHLKSLDVLDLSKNHFFGQIPSSLSQVDRLSMLDLSSNNLSGKIPTSTQLQTRDASAFVGNPQLCGDPLPKKCPNEEKPSMSNGVKEDGHENELITNGFYISLAVGFVLGFWGFCGTLTFNKSLRYAYLKLLNDTGDWLYVIKEIHKRKLLRLIQS